MFLEGHVKVYQLMINCEGILGTCSLSPTAVEKYCELRGRQPRQNDKVSKTIEVKKGVRRRRQIGSRLGSSQPDNKRVAAY